MIIFSYIKRTFKNNTNVKGWLSWDTIKENGRIVKDIAKDIAPEQSNSDFVPTTFEEVMKHYNLTENDIKKRTTIAKMTALFCGVLTVTAFCWALYLFYTSMILSGFVALSVSVLMSSYTLREYVSYKQLKERKLTIAMQGWIKKLMPAGRK